MKKILMGVLIFFLLLIAFSTITGKISIGSFKIAGIDNIKSESKKLDNKIDDISKLTSSTYPQKLEELKTAQKNMLKSKQDYEEKLVFSTESEIQSANRLENYNIEFLWTKIGKYATKQGINLVLEVQNGVTPDLKNLACTATGRYIPITDFIYSLEEDDELNFSIENFKIEPNSEDGSILIATFTLTDVSLKVNENVNYEIEKDDEKAKDSVAENNTSNTTNSNTTTSNTTNNNSTNTSTNTSSSNNNTTTTTNTQASNT